LAVRKENGHTEVKDVTLPVLGNDGKYLPSVGLHPDPEVDVAVVNVTEDMVREHSDFANRIPETHEALMTDLLIPRADFHEAAIGIGPQIFIQSRIEGKVSTVTFDNRRVLDRCQCFPRIEWKYGRTQNQHCAGALTRRETIGSLYPRHSVDVNPHRRPRGCSPNGAGSGIRRRID